jgi:hypothetical protein
MCLRGRRSPSFAGEAHYAPAVISVKVEGRHRRHPQPTSCWATGTSLEIWPDLRLDRARFFRMTAALRFTEKEDWCSLRRAAKPDEVFNKDRGQYGLCFALSSLSHRWDRASVDDARRDRAPNCPPSDTAVLCPSQRTASCEGIYSGGQIISCPPGAIR